MHRLRISGAWLWLWLSLGCAAHAAPPARSPARPPDVRAPYPVYTSTPTPFSPRGPARAQAELDTLARVCVADGRVGDGRLSEVAEAIAAAGPEACDDIALLMSLSQAAGLPNPLPQVVCVSASTPALGASALARELRGAFAQLHTSHVGLGAAEHGQNITLTALLDTRKLSLAAVPRKLAAPGKVRIVVTVPAPLHDPQLVFTRPDGTTRSEARATGRALTHVAALAAPGMYGIEVVAVGPRGPEVLANLRVAVATDEPAFAPIPRTPRVESAGEFEALVASALDDERARRSLAHLTRDAALDGVARAHASDMQKRNYFGHLDPEAHGPLERLRAAGVSVLEMHENLARVATPGEAHALWLASPAHRAALLAANVRAVGIGAAATADGSYLVVALYATLTPAAPKAAAHRMR